MAYDEGLAQRVRTALAVRPDVDERRMFGGIAFLIAGNMCCGVLGEDLIVRLDPGEAGTLTSPERGTRPFDVTGRPMRGWLFVAPEATAEDADLEEWLGRAEDFASSLPPK
jgi:hypothetical protein